MAKHLGRNPFEKRTFTSARTADASKSRAKPQEKRTISPFSEWALIQIPAQSIWFVLRAVLRFKSLFERN
jgi:hypothetical protein